MSVFRPMWCFLVMVLCSTNAWSQGVRTVDFIVMDPGKFVQGQLRGELSGSSGVRMSLDFRDDGHAPDEVAKDGIYSARTKLGDHAVHIDFQSSAKRWSVDTSLPPSPGDTAVRLRLGPEQGVVVIHGDEPMIEHGGGAPSPGTGGTWLWLVLFGGVGIGIGLGLTRLKHVPVRPAEVDGDIPVPDFAPRRVDASRYDALLRTLTSKHFVVVLGDSVELDRVVNVTSDRVTPFELVRRVELLALESGGSVALVVGDVSRVEAEGDRSKALDVAVGRRFSLWVLAGPDSWTAYDEAGTA
ncbi:MAG: hypothetical protein CL930_05880 [Deltaproteobacteria bacterium]|nr:hypothetical protein [Deltaproteobacteria bacterium]